MVMNTEQELNEARIDFSRGYFGQPWDYRLSDEKWREARDRESFVSFEFTFLLIPAER